MSFNLSLKDEYFDDGIRWKRTDHVKEFIRLLKDRIRFETDENKTVWLLQQINTLAGEDLI